MTAFSPVHDALASPVAFGNVEDLGDRVGDVDASRRSWGTRRCQFCGLGEAEHGIHLIHRFIDPDPTAATDLHRSCDFTPLRRSGLLR